MKIAHVQASNVVPPLAIPQLNENMLKKVVGNDPKMTYLGTFPKKIEVDSEIFLKV